MINMCFPGLLVVFGRAGKKKDEVKALPLMFTSNAEHFKVNT